MMASLSLETEHSRCDTSFEAYESTATACTWLVMIRSFWLKYSIQHVASYDGTLAGRTCLMLQKCSNYSKALYAKPS
jgi:hypothetical protein